MKRNFRCNFFLFEGRYLHSLNNSEKHLSVICTHTHTHDLVANDIYFSKIHLQELNYPEESGGEGDGRGDRDGEYM